MAFTNYIQKITDTGGTTHDLLDSSASHFIKGTQTESTNVWTGPLPDGVSNYYDGLMIDYWLPFAGTSTAATLNLGGKGAKPVYRGNAATSGVTTHIAAKTVAHLTYVVDSGINSGNGAWIMSSYYDSNSNDTATGYTRFSHGTYTTTTAVGRYVICLSKSPTSVVPVTAVNDSTATNKTLTTDTFNPFEPIFYYTNNGSTTQTAANAALSVSYLWRNYSNINLGYSFNTGTTLTNNKDVYIKATPTSGYMATLASTPIVQALPTTDDGFIYIKLGHACSTSNIAMAYEHPIYWYKNGAVRHYGGDAATVSGIPIKLGYTTSGNNRAVQADSNGNLYVTQKDDNSNTTYTLTNALASHKFTWTLTPSSGSATTTTAELAAGTGITLTDDTTNKKITIACSVTNTDEKIKLTSQATSGTYPLIFGPTSITSNSTYQGYYNTGITVNPSTKTVTATTFVGALTGTASGNLTSSSTLDATKLSGTIPTGCYTNTKNTAGTTNKTGTKMFLVAATEQSANPTTYSNSNCYIGTDNCLYSGGTKVLTAHQTAVTSLTTTAGTHVTKTSATGAVSMTIPTKTSHLTNDSGFIMTAAQIIRW